MTTTLRRSPGTSRPRRTLVRSAAALAVGSALALSGGVAAGARADAPTRTYIDTTDYPTVATEDGICPFPVTLSGVAQGWLTDITDNSGVEHLLFTGTGTDTFYGPGGASLTGTPYHGSVHATVDAQGNVTRIFGAGVAEVVPLHNGTTFRAAGRADFLKRSDPVFIIVPDSGSAQNLDEFCRELAP